MRLTRSEFTTLAAIVLLGLLHLPLPFTGDQALFLTGALELREGETLYRDFWDTKQPAIFLFYLLGGSLFGFREVGIHAFELLYWVAFSAFLLVALRPYYDRTAVACLAPLLTVGFYYGVSSTWHLTQVEGLVGAPLFLTLWLASRGPATVGSMGEGEAPTGSDEERRTPVGGPAGTSPSPTRPAEPQPGRGSATANGIRWQWVFLSGVMGGVVLLFKLLFLPIVLGFWLSALLRAVTRERRPVARVLVQVGLPLLLGLSLPLLVVLEEAARVRALEALRYTFLEYPARAVAGLPPPGMPRFLGGFSWFAAAFAPLLGLGFLGAYASWMRGRDLLTVNLVLWAVLGLAVIFAQRLSWWEYHYLLLVVPQGILATRGVDVLWGHCRRERPPWGVGGSAWSRSSRWRCCSRRRS